MCDVGDDDLDNYGFLRSSNSDSVSANYGVGGSSVPILKVLLIGGGILGGIFVLLLGIVAGVHSWGEFTHDNIINKSVKSLVAVMFAPFYLLYTSIKLLVFRA